MKKIEHEILMKRENTMLSLKEISDRIEIYTLLDAYAGAIDRVDMVALDAVFTADAWIDYTAFAEWGAIAGHYPEIRRWLPEAMAKAAGFQHVIANKEITIDGDRGTGRILCLNPMVLTIADPDGRPRVGFHGLWYVDEYVRTEDGWRISRRTEERCFSHNFPISKMT
jgi:hypothetical protein